MLKNFFAHEGLIETRSAEHVEKVANRREGDNPVGHKLKYKRLFVYHDVRNLVSSMRLEK